MQLVLNTAGLILRVKSGAFSVQQEDEHRLISPKQLHSIAVTAPCLLSTAAVELAAEYGIPIYLFDRIGDATACLRSPYFESIATLRRKQVYFDDGPEAINWVLDIMLEKTDRQIRVLRYLADRRPSRAEQLNQTARQLSERTKTLADLQDQLLGPHTRRLMGWEGQQSRNYWSAVGAALPKEWAFARRSRRPALDGFHAALNYLYGMLYTVVEQALFATGLDPHLGILHVDQHNAPTLAFDLIEPFRPLVDRLLIELCMKRRLQSNQFDQRREGWYLNNAGKRLIIPAFNAWLQTKARMGGRQRTHRLHIYQAAADLASRIRDYPLPAQAEP